MKPKIGITNRVEFELFEGKVAFVVEIKDSFLTLSKVDDKAVLAKIPVIENASVKMIMEVKK